MISFKFIFYFVLVTLGYFSGLYISYKNVLINHGPNSNEIRNIKYNHDNKCYVLKPRITNCR